jgi:uncharacterized lipoprotein YbaY
MTPAQRSISGTLEFHDVRRPASGVTVYVRVEEASRADAPAAVVAQIMLRGVEVAAAAPPLPFDLSGIPTAPAGRYVVRAHADVDGDGRITRGDYISTQSYPVLAGAAADVVRIVLHEVR